jgi:hypothetical protein
MKLNKHEQAKPNVAGLTSQVQRADMKLILAGRWPPLKPLPVFKYGTDEYRAEIHFDSTRGEWVCRKTSLASNKVQELRGGFTEMAMALPHGPEEDFTEAVAEKQQEKELENEANRRLQTILEWRENYGNGALYSELQDYLSESQQDEIYDSIRMTLTARQLQFNPKNVEFVFDALRNAGGRLATLMEIAQRNKAEQEADAQAQAKAPALEAERQVPVEAIHPTHDRRLQKRTAPQASEIVACEILDVSPPSLVEDLQEKVHYHTPVAGLGPQVRTDRVESSADRIDDAPSHFHVLEMTGFQVAALVFLFAVIGFTVGLTVGRGPVGKRLRDAQKSTLAVDATSPAPPNRPSETTSPTSTPPAANTFNTPEVNPPASETEESRSESPSAQSLNAQPADSATRVRPTGPSSAVTSRSPIDSDNPWSANNLDHATPSEEKSKESTRDSESFAKVPSTDSNSSPTMESEPSANPKDSPERNGSTGLIARNAPPPASSKPAHSPKAVGPIRGAPRNPNPRRVTPTTGAAPYPSPPSAILVSVPAKGRKSFRLTFPEKPIAASSSFAMTSQLSVLVSPEPGPAVAHKPARLQAGDLVSYVWPRYPRPGDRYGSTETVKVRATIGQLGQPLDIKLVSGSISLLPATMSAIRRWRYTPTLLNGRPVQAQQDVTIEFRPPQYLSHVSTHDSSHN